MLDRLTANWWVLALRGVLGILIGIAAFVTPLATLATLIIVFGAFMFLDGIFALTAALSGRAGGDRWWLLLDGVAGIIAGLVALFMPGLASVTLLFLIAAWAIVSGILRIVDAIRLRRQIENEWMLVISGILSVVLGIVLFLLPGAGLIAWAWTIGAYAFLAGVLLLVLAFRLRSLRPAGGSGHRPATLAG